MKEPSRIYQVRLEDLIIDEDFNARIDSEDLQQHIRGLAISITAVGIKQPLTAHLDEEEKTHVDDGACRMAAVMLANKEMGAELETVPVRYEQTKFNNEADRTEGLLIRNGGKPLNLLEQSDVVKRLLVMGRTEEQIASRTGISITHVKNLVLLSTASEAIRNMVIEGRISPSNAIEAIRKFDTKAEEALADAMNMVEGQGKKKVTQRQLKTRKKGVDWKEFGPKLQEMLHLICFSLDEPQVKEANIEEAKALLMEISELEA